MHKNVIDNPCQKPNRKSAILNDVLYFQQFWITLDIFKSYKLKKANPERAQIWPGCTASMGNQVIKMLHNAWMAWKWWLPEFQCFAMTQEIPCNWPVHAHQSLSLITSIGQNTVQVIASPDGWTGHAAYLGWTCSSLPETLQMLSESGPNNTHRLK